MNKKIFLGIGLIVFANILFISSIKADGGDNILIFDSVGGSSINSCLFANNSSTVNCYDSISNEVVLSKTPYSDSSLPIPKKSGYKFLGWYVNATKVSYFGEVLSQFSGTVTLTAKWEEHYVELKNEMSEFNFKCSVLTQKCYDTRYNNELSYLEANGDLPMLSNSNYVFKGWYENEKKVTNINDVVGDSISAIWDSKVINDFFRRNYYQLKNTLNSSVQNCIMDENAKGETNCVDQYYNIILSNPFTLPTLSADGYTFLGWYDEVTNEKVTKLTDLTKRNVTYFEGAQYIAYTKWQKDSKLVTYNYNNMDISFETNKDNISIVIKKVAESSEIYKKVASLIDEKDYQIIDLGLISDGINITPDSKVTLAINIPENYDPTNLVIYGLDDAGEVNKIDYEIKEGKLVFTSNYYSQYVISSKSSLTSIETFINQVIKNSEELVDNPDTGDIIIYILSKFIIVLLLSLFVILKLKKKKLILK